MGWDSKTGKWKKKDRTKWSPERRELERKRNRIYTKRRRDKLKALGLTTKGVLPLAVRKKVRERLVIQKAKEMGLI